MYPRSYILPWQSMLTMLLTLPSMILTASLVTLGTCPVTDRKCQCNFIAPFYSLKCASYRDRNAFINVVQNFTDNAVVFELDDARFDCLPFNDMTNSSLHTFIVSNSTFERFSTELSATFDNLRHLSLENVIFRQEPSWEEFKLLNRLQILFLHNTSIPSVVPERFGSYVSKNLMVLTIADSNITDIEERSLESLSDLLVLRISHNHLKNFHRNVLPVTSKIEQIRLDYNNIHSLSSGTFENLPNLSFVSLSNNTLSTLPEDVFGPLWNVNISLDLRDNPIKCDCRISWILSKDSKPASLIGQCAHPKRLFGKSLENLTSNDFDC